MTHTMIFGLAADTLTWGERASTAGIVSLQGMATIFLVLAILWGGIELMHRVLVGKKSEPATKIEKETPAAVEQSAPAPQPVAASDDGAVVAAIIAAISAMREGEGQSGGFRVVSFKRVGSKSGKNRF